MQSAQHGRAKDDRSGSFRWDLVEVLYIEMMWPPVMEHLWQVWCALTGHAPKNEKMIAWVVLYVIVWEGMERCVGRKGEGRGSNASGISPSAINTARGVMA